MERALVTINRPVPALVGPGFREALALVNVTEATVPVPPSVPLVTSSVEGLNRPSTINDPFPTIVGPVLALVPSSVQVLEPSLTNAPAPLKEPAKFVVVLLLTMS